MTAVTKLPTPRRWGLRITLGVAALIVLTWAAPTIAAMTSLPTWICARAFRSLNGTTHVGGASLGWFSPVTLFGVEFRDPEGRTVVYISKVETDRTLLSLLMNPDDLGAIQVSQPNVEFTFGKSDSNFERILEKFLRMPAETEVRSSGEAASVPKVHLEIVGGTIKIEDTVAGQVWQVRSLAAGIYIGHDAPGRIKVSMRGITHDGNEPGSFDADISLVRLDESNPKATFKGRFSSVPLQLLNVALRRYLPDWVLTGSLQGSGEVVAEIRNGKPCAEVSGVYIVNHFLFRSPTTSDLLYFERARIPCKVRLEDRKVIVEQADLDWDYGKARLHGAFDFAAPWRDAFAQADFDLALDLNPALICQSIPDFHANHGFFLHTGNLKTQIQSRLVDGAVTWSGKIRMTDVTGLNGKQHINWPEPVVVDFKARDLHTQAPFVDHLRCSARFLQMESSSTREGFTLTANADLQKLAEPLAYFIDPEIVKVAGKANATINLQRTDSNKFVATGNAEVKQFNLSGLTSQPWLEEAISIKFDALGNTERIETARMDATVGQDHLTVKLAESVSNFATPSGLLRIEIDGNVAEWQKRARVCTNTLDDWQLSGQGNLQFCVRPTSHGLDWTDGNLVAINFRADGPSLWIQEPAFNAKCTGRWDARTGRIDFTQCQVACPTVQVDAAKLTWHTASRNLQGSVQIAGDLGRLRRWTHDPRSLPGAPIAGSISGKLDLNASAEHVDADFDLSAKNFRYGKLTDPTWNEPEVQCVGRGAYAPDRDSFAIDKLKVTSSVFHADARGTVANLSGTRDFDLSGVMTYDLEKLESHLQPFLGKDVKVAGKDARAFTLAGPLYPKAAALNGNAALQLRLSELKGESTIAWKSLKGYGYEVGPGDVKVALREGWLQLYPIETTLNGGKLRIQPNLRFEPEPTALILLPGPMIEKAKLNPAVCAGMLGLALPMLANATETEGTVSLEVESGQLPKSAPTSGEFKGTLVVHDARIGVNPLIRELSALLKIPPAPGVVKNCNVPIHLVNGKVHHSNLEVAFCDFTLKSSGSVGMDGTLALVVEMPIPARVAAAANLTPAQAKQTLRIPIGGTVDHPRLDPRALESLTATLTPSLVENRINAILQPLR